MRLLSSAFLILALGSTCLALVASAPQQLADKLTIEAPEWEDNPTTQTTDFRGGVVIRFGPSTIRCDEATVYRNEERLITRGATTISDPEGMIRAEQIEVVWREGQQFGKAINPIIQLGELVIRGNSLETRTLATGPQWIVYGAKVSLNDLTPIRTGFRARKLTIYPGRHADAEGVQYELLGGRLTLLERQRINLDPRVTGFQPPSLADRRGVGYGITWESTFLLSENSSIGGKFSTFPGIAPESRLQYTFSPLDPAENAFNVAPKSDLDERMDDGWFNNVRVKTPETEKDLFRRRKLSYSLGTLWNLPTKGRVDEAESVSKLAELAYEFGGTIGDAGHRTNLRAQRIREENDPWVDRVNAQSTVHGPWLKLHESTVLHTRADFFGTLSEKNSYGFARAEAGFITNFGNGFRIGAGYAVGAETGTPDFAFDRLGATHVMLIRADYRLGPYAFSYLTKYDFGRKSWYDKEWEISIIAGSFEPFVARREFPSDFRLGVRFRITDVVGRLGQRNVRRSSENPPPTK